MKIIYQNQEGGVSVICPTGALSLDEVIAKDVPAGANYQIVDESDIPSDRFFRDAWTVGNGKVDVDLDKAKKIGHRIRRTKRAEEFAPFDDVISKQIPGNDFDAAEAERQKIRNKYMGIQAGIDAAVNPEEIKALLEL